MGFAYVRAGTWQQEGVFVMRIAKLARLAKSLRLANPATTLFPAMCCARCVCDSCSPAMQALGFKYTGMRARPEQNPRPALFGAYS